MRRSAQWKIVAEKYPCLSCGAAPGRACITTGRRRSNEIHAARAKLASMNGWRDPDEQPPDSDRRPR